MILCITSTARLHRRRVSFTSLSACHEGHKPRVVIMSTTHHRNFRTKLQRKIAEQNCWPKILQHLWGGLVVQFRLEALLFCYQFPLDLWEISGCKNLPKKSHCTFQEATKCSTYPPRTWPQLFRHGSNVFAHGFRYPTTQWFWEFWGSNMLLM